MDQCFADYLSMSPQGYQDYLEFILELANIAIRNVGKNGITEETAAKARICREDALKRLKQFREQRENTAIER